MNCPICKASAHHWFKKYERSIVRCLNCGFIFVPEGLLLTDSGKTIYEDDENVFNQDGNADYYFDSGYNRSFREKYDWVRRYAPDSKYLLDVGANLGHFLKAAGDYYTAVGIELSPQAVSWSREHLGVDNHVGSLYTPPDDLGGPFDIVTSWDVIEHIPDPVGAMRIFSKLTRPGGLLFLSTPDSGSVIARIMRSKWHYHDPAQHISLFNKKNLSLLLLREGFRPIAWTHFGHFYRVRYLQKRMQYLHNQDTWQNAVASINRITQPLSNFILYLKLWDVMGVVAVRKG